MMFDDKVIKIEGFRNQEQFILENRNLWCEIVLSEIDCDKCKSGNSITFHIKDIPKLIKGLNVLMKIQNKKHISWLKRSKKRRKLENKNNKRL